jgi:membrane associated rhomboid family serine protease
MVFAVRPKIFMKQDEKQILYAFMPVLLIDVFVLLVKWGEVYFGASLAHYGILPRSVSGLRGIVFAPFIHGDFNHIVNNLLTFTVLGWALRFFYKEIFWKILFLSMLMTGLWTWISARESYHIGLSGVLYAVFGFLLFSGFIRKNIPLIAISFFVALMYGSMVWGILPVKQAISWESHFWGFVAGIILAVYFRNEGGIPSKKYDWENEEDTEDNSGEADYWQSGVEDDFQPYGSEWKSSR